MRRILLLALAALLPTIARADNLIVNPGFEFNFNGWTRDNNGFEIKTDTPHDGVRYASCGTMYFYGDLRQTVATVPGATYELTFWLSNGGGPPCEFQVWWNGSQIGGFVNEAEGGYTLRSFSVTGTGSDTLRFAAATTPGSWRLDDVALTGPRPPGLYAWGSNWAGQLGIGSGIGDLPNPHHVILGAPMPVAGESHSFAYDATGALLGWGYNGYGQLGLGTTNYWYTPTSVPIAPVLDLTCGALHSLSLTAPDTVNLVVNPGFENGLNSWTTNGGFIVQSIEPHSGSYHASCGTATYTGELRQRLATYPDAEHEVSFWLRNRGGQPATMTVYWNDTVLATYQWGDTAYTYQSFTVTGTGDDTLKFAASSTPGDWRLDDVAVRGLREPGLQAMGYNGTGQLGLSDYANRRSATHVELDDVVSMAAGYEHSLALTTDGRLWACGSNGSGQLGLSGSGNRAVYTEVPLRNVRQVVAGAYHSAAVTADGTVWTWGSNEHGQLGLGHNANRDVPTVALYPSGSTLVAGYHHMMAVTEAGELYVCGRNSEGQLGLDHSSPVWTPTTLDLEAAISVWLGAYSSFAQTTDGRLWAWGANWNGRLGLGDWYQRNLPVDTGLSNIRFLAPGGSHALATVNSNRAPSATSQEVTTTAGAPVAVTLNGTDAETDPITFTLITSPSHGVLSGSAPNLIYSPEAGFSGTDAFMYRVSDPTGPGGTAIVWVVVGDRGPDAHDQDVVTGEGLAKAVTLTATDPDGDPLRFWIVDGPDHGTLTGAPPSVTYTPAAGYTGPDSFTFRASDAREESGTGTVSIRVNAIPVANPQTVSATSGIAKPITLTGSDGDGDSLTYSILTQPVHGNVTGTPQNVTYTSAATFHGTDSFTFKVNDAYDDSAPATVTVNVDAPVPVALALSPTSAGPGSDVSLVVRGRGFVSDSVVRWNGVDLVTGPVTGKSISATVPASYLDTPGGATVTVHSPGPGGGLSNGLIFNIGQPSIQVASVAVSKTLGGVLTARVTLKNTGKGIAKSTKITLARMQKLPGGPVVTTSTTLPITVGDIAAGHSVVVTPDLGFPSGTANIGDTVLVQLGGTFTGGGFTSSKKCTVLSGGKAPGK